MTVFYVCDDVDAQSSRKIELLMKSQSKLGYEAKVIKNPFLNIKFIVSAFSANKDCVFHFFNITKRFARLVKWLSLVKKINCILHLEDTNISEKWMKAAYKRSKVIVFSSIEEGKKFLNTYPEHTSKTLVINDGICTESFVPDDQGIQLSLSNKIIALGFDDDYEKLTVVLECLKYLPPKYILDIGVISDNFADVSNRIVKIAENIGVRNRMNIVQLDGDDSSCREFYLSGSVYVNTGKVQKQLEVLACGIPTVTIGMNLPISGCVSIKSASPKNLARAVSEITSNFTDVDSNSVRRLFSWDSRAEIFHQIYNSF